MTVYGIVNIVASWIIIVDKCASYEVPIAPNVDSHPHNFAAAGRWPACYCVTYGAHARREHTNHRTGFRLHDQRPRPTNPV